MNEDTGAAPQPEQDGAVTIGGVHKAVVQGFLGVNKMLKNLSKSMKSIEAGLADVGEFQKKIGRVLSFVRQGQILAVLERMSAHPANTVSQAAALVFKPLTGGYPSASALASACYRVGVKAQVGCPPD